MENEDYNFGVWAEIENHPKPLIQVDLTFGRLIDDIIYPYENKEAFFIDGVPLQKEKIKRIKILQLKEGFSQSMSWFRRDLRNGDIQKQKVYGEQYLIRIEDILRQHSEDVTAQVIKAFDRGIKPDIKQYLPNKQQLITAATHIFVESMKMLK
jgi:hypothetical protein